MTDTYLALDLEMNQPSRKIIQVGISIAKRDTPADAYLTRSWILDPEEPIDVGITELTGISDYMIQEQAVPWTQMAQELGSLIDAHKPFVNPVTWGGGDAEGLLAGLRERNIEFPYFGRRWLDIKTIHAFKAMAMGKSGAGGLKSVMGQHRLPFVGKAHRADVDAYNTLRLFFKMMESETKLQDAAKLLRSS